jgi:hypothetical protein
VEWHRGSLCPPVRFIVTSLARPPERIVGSYNRRGSCERCIKEAKGAISWARLSHRPFGSSSTPRPGVQPWYFNQPWYVQCGRWRCKRRQSHWSLTSSREEADQDRRQGRQPRRYVTFQMAEFAEAGDENTVARWSPASAGGSMTGRWVRCGRRRQQKCMLMAAKSKARRPWTAIRRFGALHCTVAGETRCCGTPKAR